MISLLMDESWGSLFTMVIGADAAVRFLDMALRLEVNVVLAVVVVKGRVGECGERESW